MHEQDRIYPEGDSVSGRIENAYLALIFAGSQVAEAELETEWNRAEPTAGRWRGRDRGRFKRFLAPLIQGDKGNEGRGRSGLSRSRGGAGGSSGICLQIDVHLTAGIEYACHAGDELQPFLHKGIF